MRVRSSLRVLVDDVVVGEEEERLADAVGVGVDLELLEQLLGALGDRPRLEADQARDVGLRQAVGLLEALDRGPRLAREQPGPAVGLDVE